MVRTPVQTNHMCDCPNRLHIDVVGTAITDKLGPKTVNSNRPHDAQAQSTRESQQRKKEKVSNNTHLIHVHLSGPYQLIYLSKNSHQLK
jgi:hypothetical protein